MYVTPTPNMIIKQNHSFVDPSGMVHTPCITNWLYPRSNLLDTVTEMSIIFGSETPLYSKPANYTGPAPMYQAAQPTSSYPMVNPMHPMQTSPPGQAGSSYYGTTVSPPPPPTQPPGMALHQPCLTTCFMLMHAVHASVQPLAWPLVLAWFVKHKSGSELPCSQCRLVRHSSWPTYVAMPGLQACGMGPMVPSHPAAGSSSPHPRPRPQASTQPWQPSAHQQQRQQAQQPAQQPARRRRSRPRRSRSSSG